MLAPFFLPKKEDHVSKKEIVFTQSKVPFAADKTLGVYKDENGKIWFHGPNVARLLGYDRPDNMYRMLDEENKAPHIVRGVNKGVSQTCISISEAGFYQVVMLSRTDFGKRLMKLVCEEILPSIRQNGTFIAETATPEQIKFAVEAQIVEAAKRLAMGKKQQRGESLAKRCAQLMNTKGYLEVKNESVEFIREQLRVSPKGSQDLLFNALRNAADAHMANRIAEKTMDAERLFGAQLLLLEIEDNRVDYLKRSRAKRLSDMHKKP